MNIQQCKQKYYHIFKVDTSKLCSVCICNTKLLINEPFTTKWKCWLNSTPTVLRFWPVHLYILVLKIQLSIHTEKNLNDKLYYFHPQAFITSYDMKNWKGLRTSERHIQMHKSVRKWERFSNFTTFFEAHCYGKMNLERGYCLHPDWLFSLRDFSLSNCPKY